MVFKRRGLNSLLTGCSLFCVIISLSAQNEGIEGNGVREEVQRYLGYEDLFYRFISLPFDMTMNSNVKGFYLDIGLLFLILLPILFLFKKISIIEKWVIASLLVLMVTITLPINYHQRTQIPFEKIAVEIEKQMNFGNPNVWTPRYAQLKMTQIANTFFQPIHTQLKKLTGQKDYVTLPLLGLTLIWLLSILYRVTKERPKIQQSLLIFTAIYGFLWFYLSAGIVWYGILFFPLALLFIFIGIQSVHWLKKGIVIGFASFWLVFALIYRLSDCQPYNRTISKGLIDKNTLLYQSGMMSKEDYLDTYFPNYSTAIDWINREQASLILVVNTMLPFYISNYESRALKDGNLSSYIGLVNTFPDKIERAKAMKAYGIRYILLGLNTPNLDKTPEQSLAKKFDLMTNFLKDNEQVSLLTTDQKIINEAGVTVSGIFNGTIQSHGTFALFELK